MFLNVLSRLALFLSIFCFMLFTLAGCAPKSAPNIVIENGTFRMPAPGQTTASAYFDILNTGGADILLSASTPFSGHVELHTHLHEDGIMKMRKIDSVKVATKTVTAFKRGGLHVMIFNVEAPKDITDIPMQLHFQRFGDVSFTARVTNAIPKMDHNKMSHEKMDHEKND